MHRLEELYLKQIVPALQKELGVTNVLALPRLKKVVVNVGINSGQKDGRMVEVAEETLRRITGQKPVRRLARKSISNFKIREGQVVGATVTLRGKRMYDFLDKLINVALPRVRDFRGIDPKNVDATGNLSIGFREHLSFPEIKADEVEKIHGIQVTVTTSAKTKTRGLVLFQLLGLPFFKA